jgi:peptidoglycan/LPS O-acetylase OafA/YrhL
MRATLLGTETIAARMAAGRTSGFDYLRAVLSVAVIAFHSIITCYGPGYELQFWQGWWRPPIALILPAFFGLSGFLVAGSLARSATIVEFLTLRAVRLVPALFVEVVISALLLGPLLTSASLQDYFTDHRFYSYWLNIIGEIHFELPALFTGNPDPGRVNLQLWTIPIELKCYLLLAATALIGAARRKGRMLIVLVLMMVLLPMDDALKGQDLLPTGTVTATIMIESFLAGVTLFLFRDQVPLSVPLFLLSAALSLLCLADRHASYVACLPITYLTLYIGLAPLPRSWLARLGDYSYGLYVYGYALQQSYADLLPGYRVWWLSLLAVLPTAVLCAILSWHFVERPALNHRRAVVAAVLAALAWCRYRAAGVLRRPDIRQTPHTQSVAFALSSDPWRGAELPSAPLQGGSIGSGDGGAGDGFDDKTGGARGRRDDRGFGGAAGAGGG